MEVKLNKDGSPRKQWTAKNPRKKPTRTVYNEIHVSLSDEIYAFIESYCGRKKVGSLVRKLLADFMVLQNGIIPLPTKEERQEAMNKLLAMYVLPNDKEVK